MIHAIFITQMVGRHSGHCSVRENGQYLNASDITIATILSDAGYHTALIGKWGLGQIKCFLQSTLCCFSMQGRMALLHHLTTKDFNTSMVLLTKRMLIIIIRHTYGEMR